MSKAEQIERWIQALQESIPEVRGVMVAASDGLPIAHSFPSEEAARVAAMSATALGLGRRISETSRLDELQEVVIRGAGGSLVIYRTGPRAVMAVAVPQGANLGLLHLEAREVARKIAALLEEGREEA